MRFVNINSVVTVFNPRRISNSRMRLAKGFFLPLIAAEMRSKFCRPASGGRPPDVGRTSARGCPRRFAEYFL